VISRRLLVIGAGVVVTALAATFVTLTQSQRVEYGSWSFGGEGAVYDGDDHAAAAHPARAGAVVEIVVSVRNPGPLPVTLDDVSVTGPALVVEPTVMIHEFRSGACCVREHATAFHAVAIPVDQEVMLWLAVRQTGADPPPPCSWLSLEAVDAHYSVWGVSRVEPLPLRTRIEFRAPC
jgi:hypothetical protein